MTSVYFTLNLGVPVTIMVSILLAFGELTLQLILLMQLFLLE